MLKKNSTGLIVVDVQGKLARLVHDSESVIANIARLIKGAKILNLPIIWLEQTKLGQTVPELKDLLGNRNPIEKYTFSGGGAHEFIEEIEKSKCTHWLLCGIETHICIYQTALDLLDRGLNVEVAVDSVSSRNPQNNALAVSRLGSKGVGLTSVEMCFYELLRDCRVPEFKEILDLIR